MKVLFHIDESARWKMALGNILNMLQYGRENTEPFIVELVANGPAVQELQPEAAERAGLSALFGALGPQVRVCACRNALQANGTPASTLFPFVQVVPAGVVEIAARQQEGYAYIKP